MEDPFMRKTDEKHIFPSMNETDISKFIIGQSYLSKRMLDYSEQIGIHPEILSNKLFQNEYLRDVGEPKIELTEAINKSDSN